jgi:hypothetical protein
MLSYEKKSLTCKCAVVTVFILPPLMLKALHFSLAMCVCVVYDFTINKNAGIVHFCGVGIESQNLV